MAATTVDRKTQWRSNDIASIPVKTGIKILAGTIVMSDATGYAIVGADTASCIFRGIAMEQVDNTLGASGAVNVTVRKKGEFLMACDSNATFAVTDNGTAVTILDNQTVSKAATTTNDIACGILAEFVSATSGWICIDGYAK
jgi:hypothetical protein